MHLLHHLHMCNGRSIAFLGEVISVNVNSISCEVLYEGTVTEAFHTQHMLVATPTGGGENNGAFSIHFMNEFDSE